MNHSDVPAAKGNRPRVYEEVIQTIEQLIEEDGLGPGDRLPSEGELASRLQVGTRSVREAYATLRTLGVVEIRHGKGIYLAADSLDFFLESLSVSLKFAFSDTRTLLLELTYVRKLVETGLVHDFALRRTDEDVAHLARLLADMERHLGEGNLEAFNRSDLAFHTYIVERGGNRIIESLYRHLQRLLGQSIEVTQYYGGRETDCVEDHRTMLAMIRNRDAKGARQRMTAHLDQTWDTIEAL